MLVFLIFKARNSKPSSGNTINILRRLVIFLGSLLLDFIPKISADQPLISLEEEKPIPKELPNICLYFVGELLKVQGFNWGSMLIQVYLD
jgi:hypothetical protein